MACAKGRASNQSAVAGHMDGQESNFMVASPGRGASNRKVGTGANANFMILRAVGEPKIVKLESGKIK